MDTRPMNLLVKMLPGLLPLIIFIAVDAIWGTEAGLIVALGFGLAELIIILIRERRFDWFVILDTALLILLGAVSLISKNEIFFLIKPVLINMIFLAIIGISAFSNRNILLLYSRRYLKDLTFKPEILPELQKNFRILFWVLLFQTLLTLYAAFYLSKAAWAFISSGLIYILFALIFGLQMLKTYRIRAKMRKEEWFPLVDEKGTVIGKAPRSVVHKNPDLLHPVVHLHVLNSKGDIYLQKRPLSKDIQPGKWDTSVGGHIGIGENVEQALYREAKEELGLSDFKAYPLGHYVWKTPQESELSYSFVTIYKGEPRPDPSELDGGRFWKADEIKNAIGTGIFTGNFEFEFRQLSSFIQSGKLAYLD